MQGNEWFAEYHRSLYLRELPEAALLQRLEHIAQNLWSTGPNSEVTPPRSPENRQRLLRAYVHAIAEQVRRGRIVRSISEAEIRQNASLNYVPPDLVAPFTGSPVCWVKFGKREHIRPAFERGLLKVTLASSYNDPSLNPAQRDDELHHLSRTPNKQMLFTLRGLDENGQEVDIPHQPLEYFEGISSSDFCVWCCSAAYDARVFSDFKDYNAALIIRDQQAFSYRLENAMKAKLANISMQAGRVQYYDPYDIDPTLLRPIFVKNFQYMYQNEQRFAWEVSAGQNDKDLFIEIGPLSDICDVLEFRPTAFTSVT